jgi:hypothetical protein
MFGPNPKVMQQMPQSIDSTLCCWCFVWRYSACGQAVKLRSSVKPNLGELKIGHANFVSLRFARPFETFFGHRAVFRGRFHRNFPSPSSIVSVVYNGRAPAISATARGI